MQNKQTIKNPLVKEVEIKALSKRQQRVLNQKNNFRVKRPTGKKYDEKVHLWAIQTQVLKIELARPPSNAPRS
jgi:hypothetical protein